jgi:hypothetical protein
MAHVLIPPLHPGARKSDYAPVEQRFRTAAKGKARAGDNSGSNELMHVLQNAFESNWFGPGSSAEPRKKKRGRGRPKKPAEEIVVVVDDEEDDEAVKENPTSLDQALAKAFTHNSANPNVTASASTGPAVASRSTRQSAKETRAETLSRQCERGSCRVVVEETRS